MSAGPDALGSVSWTTLRLGPRSWPVRPQVCCGRTRSALAFFSDEIVGVGAGASREESLSALAGRMANADALETRRAE
jgi:hypothetical protein